MLPDYQKLRTDQRELQNVGWSSQSMKNYLPIQETTTGTIQIALGLQRDLIAVKVMSIEAEGEIIFTMVEEVPHFKIFQVLEAME